MKTDILEITYGGQTDVVNARRMKLTERARCAEVIAVAMRAKYKGEDLNDGEARPVPMDAIIASQIEEVAATIVDDDGKPVHTVDEIEEWDPSKFNAYRDKVKAFLNPTVEDVAKNSSATPGEASS